jgi:hypothetical protein
MLQGHCECVQESVSFGSQPCKAFVNESLSMWPNQWIWPTINVNNDDGKGMKKKMSTSTTVNNSHIS